MMKQAILTCPACKTVWMGPQMPKGFDFWMGICNTHQKSSTCGFDLKSTPLENCWEDVVSKTPTRKRLVEVVEGGRKFMRLE